MKFTRRDFLKISAGTTGALAAGSGLTTQWWGLAAPEVDDPGTDGDQVIPTFCELCFWKCGVLAHVKDGRVTKLVGNPEHPLSNGKLCPRGTGGLGLTYDPDRLKKPLIRREKDGKQYFEEVEWGTALDYTAERLLEVKEKYGPEALALFYHGFGGSWFKHLVKAYGTANIGAPSYAQCRGPREAGYYATFGTGLGSPEPVDMRNARVITLIGAHLGENMHNTQVQDLSEALGRGAELVVVDPRYSTAAGKAKYWLPIKPGTDVALLLAWMHVIIKEGRYDKAYIEKHADGFDELKKHVEDKTPEWAWAATGIEPDLIRETARFISAHRPASLIHPGRHTTWTGEDTHRTRSMAILTALLGAWGRRGGYINHSKMKLPGGFDLPAYPAHKPPADRPKGTVYPLATETIASGILDATFPGTAEYDIHAWMVYGTNLIQSMPVPDHTREALQKLDFMVAIDVLPAEITGYADVVLPEATYLERADDVYAASFREPFLALRQQAVEPLYDSKPGWWIAQQLAERMGLGEFFPWKDADELVDRKLAAGGYDVAEARRTGVVKGKKLPVSEEEGLALAFGTENGRIQLHSKILEMSGQQPLPVFKAPDEGPAGHFRLLTGRAPMHTFGRTTNNRFLGQVMDENEVWLNVDAAAGLPGFASRPLVSGERVVLVNQDGKRSTPVKVKLTQRIRGDCVYLVHGFGHTDKRLRFGYGKGASDSELVSQKKVDPAMGGTGKYVNFVRIERA